MIKLKPLLSSILISLGTGIIAAIITMGSMNLYEKVNLPALSPPSALFPIVWSILYILMGISSYLIYISDNSNRNSALTIYFIQLFFNFIWPIIFFNFENFLLSFIWLIILWILILAMIISFYKINPIASYLQIPYLLWVTFAGYLNLAIYLLN